MGTSQICVEGDVSECRENLGRLIHLHLNIVLHQLSFYFHLMAPQAIFDYHLWLDI